MTDMMIAGAILGLVAFTLIALALFFLIRTRLFISKSQQVKGTITQMVYTSDADGGGYSPVFRFRTLDGREVEASENLVTNPPQFKVGQTVDILYDPENPNRARIKKGFNLYFVPGLLGCMGLLFGCIGIVFIALEVRKFFIQ